MLSKRHKYTSYSRIHVCFFVTFAIIQTYYIRLDFKIVH